MYELESLHKQILRPSQRINKAVNHDDDGDTNCNWCTWNSPQRFGKILEELEIRGRIEITQIPELLRLARIVRWGSRDLRRLTITLTSVKDHQLKLTRKNFVVINKKKKN